MPGGTFESDNDDFDSQDQSETLDESNLIGDGDQGEVRTFADADARGTFEDAPEVLDLTQLIGDADEDEARDADDVLDAEDDLDIDELVEADAQHETSAATAERQDDLDGQGPEDGFDEDRLSPNDIDGLDEVRDADEARGGEDDVTDFQASDVSDADLDALGYTPRGGGARSD